MGNKIMLVRHGESEQNNRVLNDKYKPDHEIELTENGIKQAEKCGEFLESYLRGCNMYKDHMVMWVSPYKRTRQTAEIINDHLKLWDVREDDMLTELQFGIFHNLTKQECIENFPAEYERFMMNRRFAGKYYARRPEGESPFDCEIRQKLFIDTLFRDFNEDAERDIIIVGHGAAINIFKKAFFHYSHEWYENVENPGNCSVQLIEITDKKQNRDCGYIYGASIPEDSKKIHRFNE